MLNFGSSFRCKSRDHSPLSLLFLGVDLTHRSSQFDLRFQYINSTAVISAGPRGLCLQLTHHTEYDTCLHAHFSEDQKLDAALTLEMVPQTPKIQVYHS